MPCQHFTTPDGKVSGFMCFRGQSRKRCWVRGCDRPATKLCDGIMPGGKTCDRNLCEHHTTHVEPDHDYCWPHRPKEEQCPQ